MKIINPKVLIVDDQECIHQAISFALRKYEVEVIAATSIAEAVSVFSNAPEDYVSVFLDHRLDQPDRSVEYGVDIVPIIKRLNKKIKPIMVSGDETTKVFRTWIENNVNRYIYKPLEPEQIKAFFDVDFSYWKSASKGLADDFSPINDRFKIVGKSKRILAAKKIARKAALCKAPLPILVLGETGAGKELIAKGIHSLIAGGDKKVPFVTINCASYGESTQLLESELFGHEKGAFTSAASKKVGLAELADGGVLFLDEIHTLSLKAQKKLLRFLQEKTFRRVGGNVEIKVDVRVIAAGKPDLPTLVQEKEFLVDLYFRLQGFNIDVPSLAQRKIDIPLLADYFLQSENGDHGKKYFSRDALVCFKNYSWPGNVRELESTVVSSYYCADGNEIGVDDLPKALKVDLNVSGIVPIDILKNNFETSLASNIAKALLRSDKNVTLAAKLLKMPRTDLNYRIKKLGLNKISKRQLRIIVEEGGQLCIN